MAQGTSGRTVDFETTTGGDMTGAIDEPLRQRPGAPDFEAATVLDVMRLGVINCQRETSLREVARLMTIYRIHSVVVSELEGGRAWGVVSDIDLARAAGDDLDASTAGDHARTELVTIDPDASLARAAQMMADHEVAHLLVVQPHSGDPVGVLSTLDLAGVLAWGRATRRARSPEVSSQ
jgi:CBS domain-containing protein